MTHPPDKPEELKTSRQEENKYIKNMEISFKVEQKIRDLLRRNNNPWRQVENEIAQVSMDIVAIVNGTTDRIEEKGCDNG